MVIWFGVYAKGSVCPCTVRAYSHYALYERNSLEFEGFGSSDAPVQFGTDEPN